MTHPMTLNDIKKQINELRDIHNLEKSDPLWVEDINGNNAPLGTPISWRGSYNLPSMDISKDWMHSVDTVVSDFDHFYDYATSAEFFGYKGGQYLFTGDMPLWSDSEGMYSETGVIGVKVDEVYGDMSMIIVLGQCKYA